MKRQAVFWLTVVLVAAALVASAVLLVDYVRPAPVFCDAGGGCAKVRATALARPFGIPLPAIGLLGMLALGFSALLPGMRARTAQLFLGLIGGVAGAVFLIIQARLGALCPYCAVVDGASFVLAGLSFLRWREDWDPPEKKSVIGGVVVALVVALAVPLAVGFNRRAFAGDLPEPVAEEIRRTGRGKVTVVDFADFECPFCRSTHQELAPLVAARKDKVRLVRKHVPLRMHPHAMDAAKAGCCGESMGKGEEIADALFTVPETELTPEGCEKIAQAHGLDVEQFRKCVNDPATAARIEQDKAAFKQAKGHGLPTIWVDDTKLEGVQERADLEAALDGAIRRL
ncbi:MAG: thioredoxin domain-containing protein [Labilithrix sp.]|nr:thioredoxin domain-containing protein [Labilithrix sp.]MCW5815579.1 thioredoxin domain-containing protein [Labilithrix sp.]